MAEYRRIVSYLYQYKNGRRGENVGFVRVQKAQDRLKIVLNIKDKKQSEDLMLKIYFYIHKNGKLYGIFVDNIVLKGGSCEYKRAFLEREIFKNGEKIDDMHGMLLYYSREMSYGTEWDDKKIEVEQFILEQKRTQKEEDRVKSTEELEKSDKKEIEGKEKGKDLSDRSRADGLKWSPESEGKRESRDRREVNFLLSSHAEDSRGQQKVTDKIREQMKPESRRKIEREKIDREKIDEGKIGGEKRNRKEKEEIRENKNKMEERLEPQKVVPIKESRKEKQTEKMYAESDTLQKAQERFIRNSESVQGSEISEIIGNIDLMKIGKGMEIGDKRDGKNKNNKSDKDDKNRILSADKECKVEKEEKRVETKSSISMIHMQEKGERDEIEIMLRDYPKIPDIESEDLNECVKIKPRDIGKMDTVNWWLRSNRLLLYRFEQYHYLLLGKRKNQDGSWQRVVGIPGIFDSKERYLASLFQFYCFIPTESKKYKTGSFGYWVTPIR